MGYVLFFSIGMILTMGFYSFIINKVSWFTNHLVKLKCVSAFLTVVIGIQLIEI
jgi:hypothetical protein